MEKSTDICIFCYFARMRKDICGIYCVGKCCKKPDGSCDRFLNYREHRKTLRKVQQGRPLGG